MNPTPCHRRPDSAKADAGARRRRWRGERAIAATGRSARILTLQQRRVKVGPASPRLQQSPLAHGIGLDSVDIVPGRLAIRGQRLRTYAQPC